MLVPLFDGPVHVPFIDRFQSNQWEVLESNLVI